MSQATGRVHQQRFQGPERERETERERERERELKPKKKEKDQGKVCKDPHSNCLPP
jgi:hypothetical protein